MPPTEAEVLEAELQADIERLTARGRRLDRTLHALNAGQIIAGVTTGALASHIFSSSEVADVARFAIPFVSVMLGLALFLLERKHEAGSARDLTELRLDRTRANHLLQAQLLAQNTRAVEEARDENANLVRALQETNDASISEISNAVADIVHGRFHGLEQVLTMMDSYFRAQKADPFDQRNVIMADAIEELQTLAGGSMKLRGRSQYYSWLRSRLDDARIETVEAVSVRPLRLYSIDPDEQEFLRLNEASAADGKDISRIFVLETTDLWDKENRDILERHFLSRVRCGVVWQRRAVVAEGLRRGGFSIYDGKFVFADETTFTQELVDDIDPEGRQKDSGRTVQPDTDATVYWLPNRAVERYLKNFDELQRSAVWSASDDPEATRAALVAVYEHVLASGTAGHRAEADALRECIARLRTS